MPDNIIYLKDKKMIAENTMAILFDRSNIHYEYEPGLYAELTLLEPVYHDELGNSRFFSIANSPAKKEDLLFATRLVESAFNKNLKELPIGTSATIGPPMGNTPLHKDITKPGVFLIGGIGITPVRCIVEYVTEEKLPYKLFLFYSSRNSGLMAFFDDFKNWAKIHDNFTFIPTIDDTNEKDWKYEYGYINEEMISRHIKDYQQPIFYIVGPPDMVDSMEKILTDKNVSSENIRLERFG